MRFVNLGLVQMRSEVATIQGMGTIQLEGTFICQEEGEDDQLSVLLVIEKELHLFPLSFCFYNL